MFQVHGFKPIPVLEKKYQDTFHRNKLKYALNEIMLNPG
jgi:hypothetical protein